MKKMIQTLKVLVLLSCMLTIQPVIAEVVYEEITAQIVASSDDAEERAAGSMYLNSSDIELVEDNNSAQTVGLRFTELDIVKGVTVEEAYIQFTTDTETSSGLVDLTINIEASDDAVTFSDTNGDISSRILTDASVNWAPEDWNTIGEKGAAQKTPDLSSLVQSVIDRDGWESGNDMAFVITGSGARLAAAYEQDPSLAAELYVKVAYPVTSSVIEGLYINEVMSSNDSYPDEHNESDDWVELYNSNSTSLQLQGLYLSDDMANLMKWQILQPELIAPKGYKVIWADGDSSAQGNLHTNFKIKSAGETVILSQLFEGTLYILDSLTVPELRTDISYARTTDGGNLWDYYSEASPAITNSGSLLYLDADVYFSQVGGFFNDGLFLSMTSDDSTAQIRYTTDGSIPDENSTLYTSPIVISQTTVVYAKAFKPGYTSIKKETGFFVVNDYAEIGVLNIQSDPDNLWDNEKGIYIYGTNGTTSYCDDEAYRNWNQEWERPCQLIFYEPDGTLGFRADAGMQIGGACSRNLKQKTFNFYLRDDTYGEKDIDYQIFPNIDVDEFKRFKVRNSGGDWKEMLFRDGMCQSILANQVDIDLMAYRPVRVYINGEFWGIYGMRELYNKHYAQGHHGVDADSVDVLGDPYGPNPSLRAGDFDTWDRFDDFLQNNSIETAANYDTVKSYIDINEFINYHIAQMYFSNYDWPGNNVRVWRDKNGGKFRWMLFDLDASTNAAGWGGGTVPSYDMIGHMTNTEEANIWVPGFSEWPNGAEATFPFRKMTENEDFVNEYLQRTCSFTEIIFNPDRVLPMVDSVQALLEPEMDRQISTWLNRSADLYGDGDPSGGSISNWESSVDDYKAFFEERGDYIMEHVGGLLSTTARSITLSFNYDASTNGSVVLHENEMQIPYDYSGTYFRSVPVRVKAVPVQGYVFSHWQETGNTNAELDFESSSDQMLTPIFVEGSSSLCAPNRINGMSLYPNVTNDLVNIENENAGQGAFALSLYDAMGKSIMAQELNASRITTLSLGHLPSGVYVVKILNEKGERYVNRVILK